MDPDGITNIIYSLLPEQPTGRAVEFEAIMVLMLANTTAGNFEPISCWLRAPELSVTVVLDDIAQLCPNGPCSKNASCKPIYECLFYQAANVIVESRAFTLDKNDLDEIFAVYY